MTNKEMTLLSFLGQAAIYCSPKHFITLRDSFPSQSEDFNAIVEIFTETNVFKDAPCHGPNKSIQELLEGDTDHELIAGRILYNVSTDKGMK